MKSFVLALGAILLVTPAALAQEPERGFVQGLGGMTFGTETSTVFAGAFGANVARNFQITGEIGYMRNILPKYVQEDADEAASLTEDLILFFLGEHVDVDVDAKAPSFYGMAGGRVVAATSGRARPFIGASAGFAHVSPEVRLEIDGEDVTEDAIDLGVWERPDSVSKFLMAVNGGVAVNAGARVSFDLGYTYMRIFAERGINVHRAYAALGYRF